MIEQERQEEECGKEFGRWQISETIIRMFSVRFPWPHPFEFAFSSSPPLQTLPFLLFSIYLIFPFLPLPSLPSISYTTPFLFLVPLSHVSFPSFPQISLCLIYFCVLTLSSFPFYHPTLPPFPPRFLVYYCLHLLSSFRSFIIIISSHFIP